MGEYDGLSMVMYLQGLINYDNIVLQIKDGDGVRNKQFKKLLDYLKDHKDLSPGKSLTEHMNEIRLSVLMFFCYLRRRRLIEENEDLYDKMYFSTGLRTIEKLIMRSSKVIKSMGYAFKMYYCGGEFLDRVPLELLKRVECLVGVYRSVLSVVTYKIMDILAGWKEKREEEYTLDMDVFFYYASALAEMDCVYRFRNDFILCYALKDVDFIKDWYTQEKVQRMDKEFFLYMKNFDISLGKVKLERGKAFVKESVKAETFDALDSIVGYILDCTGDVKFCFKSDCPTIFTDLYRGLFDRKYTGNEIEEIILNEDISKRIVKETNFMLSYK